jgi:hypothetical protein
MRRTAVHRCERAIAANSRLAGLRQRGMGHNRRKAALDPALRPLPCRIARIVKGRYDVGGQWPEQLHLPRQKHGFYCPEHCAVCLVFHRAQLPVQALARSQQVVQAVAIWRLSNHNRGSKWRKKGETTPHTRLPDETSNREGIARRLRSEINSLPPQSSLEKRLRA